MWATVDEIAAVAALLRDDQEKSAGDRGWDYRVALLLAMDREEKLHAMAGEEKALHSGKEKKGFQDGKKNSAAITKNIKNRF